MGILSGINSDVWVSVSPSVALGGPEACTNPSADLIHYLASVHFAWDKRQTFTVQTCPTAAPVTTQNTASITAGAGVIVTPVTGTLMTNIVVGSQLSIAAGGGTAEVVTVTAKTSTTF